jgi:hypothetical protein
MDYQKVITIVNNCHRTQLPLVKEIYALYIQLQDLPETLKANKDYTKAMKKIEDIQMDSGSLRSRLTFDRSISSEDAKSIHEYIIKLTLEEEALTKITIPFETAYQKERMKLNCELEKAFSKFKSSFNQRINYKLDQNLVYDMTLDEMLSYLDYYPYE